MSYKSDQKYFFFVDESGDPNFYGRKKKDLIKSETASKYFIVGYLQMDNPNLLVKEFSKIRQELDNDDYLKDIPSLKSSKQCFHANKDCREVQERVFKVLKHLNWEAYSVVIEKKTEQFTNRFHCKKGEFYSYLIERLFENRLHLYPEIDIYFAKMKNVTHAENMWQAIEKAKQRFMGKWGIDNQNTIRIFMQNPHQIAGLQAIDYVLWSIHRVYHHNDFRYFDFLGEKIKLIHDLSCGKDLYGTYFNSKKRLTKDRFLQKKES